MKNLKRVKSLFALAVKGFNTKGSFINSITILFSGKAIIIGLGFLATPFIARLFTPAEYGTFALFNSIVANIALLTTLRLSALFVIVPSERKFKILARTLSGLALIGAIICSFFLFLFEDIIFLFFENSDLYGMWFVFGLAVYLHAMRDFFGHWNVREKNFQSASNMAIGETVGIKGSALVYGLSKPMLFNGLIFGDLLGRGFHVVLQLLFFVKNRIGYLKPNLSPKNIVNIVKKYKEYPLFVLPSAFLAQFSVSLVIFYLSAIYAPAYVGSYSMANSILTIPIMLIAYTAQPVLMQKIVEKKLDIVSRQVIVNRFLIVIIAIGICITLLTITLSKPLIMFFLGSDWEVAAVLISWMAPLLLFEILFTSLNGVLLGLEQNKKLLSINALKALFIGTLLIALPFLSHDFFSGIKIFIIGSIFFNLFILVRMLKGTSIKIYGSIYLAMILFLVVVFVAYVSVDFIQF